MKSKLIQMTKSGLRHVKNAFLFVILKIPKKYRVTAVIIASVFAAYWIAIAGTNTAWVLSASQVTFQMEGRERVERNGVSGYEVYTSEGVFSNADSLLRFKTRSGDLQNNLRFGRWYECDTQGFRFSWFNMMENIIECEEVADPQEPATLP